MTEGQLYAIYDRLANTIGPVMTVKHDAVAIRTFKDLAKDQQTTIAKHLDEYDLVKLGTLTYNHNNVDHTNDTLRLEACDPFVVVITGKALKTALETE